MALPKVMTRLLRTSFPPFLPGDQFSNKKITETFVLIFPYDIDNICHNFSSERYSTIPY